jgi:hypothetical protein
MTDKLWRGTVVVAGLLAGLVSTALTVIVPLWCERTGGLPYIAGLFGSLVGDIFGAVFAVYFWLFVRPKNLVGSIGFILISSAAYGIAMSATTITASFPGQYHTTPNRVGSLGSFPIFAVALGGTIGAFIVFLAVLLFFANENRMSRSFLHALTWCLVGGLLAVVGWEAGPSLGRMMFNAVGPVLEHSPSTDADATYNYSLFLVWQTGMGLAIGLLVSREGRRLYSVSVSESKTALSDVHFFRFILIGWAALVFAGFGMVDFPERYQKALGNRALSKHLAEAPSMKDLPEVKQVPPYQVLMGYKLGEYVPGRLRQMETRPIIEQYRLRPEVPVAESYSVRYRLSSAAEDDPSPIPQIDVEVREYPTPAWAQYQVFGQSTRVDLLNPERPIKFGDRIYGRVKAYDKVLVGFYLWASENRLVSVTFQSPEPDAVLKAYLNKYPARR